MVEHRANTIVPYENGGDVMPAVMRSATAISFLAFRRVNFGTIHFHTMYASDHIVCVTLETP